MGIYDYKVKDKEGNDVSLKDYEGKVLLIVNTATGCGFTPQFAKIDVNGANEDPLFTFLKSQQGGMIGSKIKWNFTKFLVDRNSKVVDRFAPTTIPEAIDKEVAKLIQVLEKSKFIDSLSMWQR